MADEKTTAEESALVSFGIIAAAGTARSLAFEAPAAAQEHDFDRADDLLEQSKEAALQAHHQQTQLLSKEASGDHTPVDVMLVHAQDHLMTSMLAQDLIKGMIAQYRQIAKLQSECA